jgi:hypothetical protein
MVNSTSERSTPYYHFIRNTRRQTQYMDPYREHSTIVQDLFIYRLMMALYAET